jgi:hypothetical protein
MRFFNTAGPVNCTDHYCLPPLDRFDLDEILALIAQKKYFVLHAPRQTGKTSCLLALMDYLNDHDFKCLYVNVEVGQAGREEVYSSMRAILNEMAASEQYYLHENFIDENWSNVLEKSGELAAFGEILSRWTTKSKRPVVLLIDEIDSLVGDTLISVLRQLRAGYTKRPAMFPQTVILCGVRDIRDYRIHSSKDKAIITGGSAFNIKAKSLRLGDFTEQEVGILYEEHTKETGQSFRDDAMDLVWDLTEGQPWLVNALGYEVCFEMKEGRDRTREITREMVEQAKENIVLRRDAHIDQLADKLKEERVRGVIQPILAGMEKPGLMSDDDVEYVKDMGLIKTEGQLRIGNKIYEEVIPRSLIYTTQLTISQEPEWYVKPEDGRLDMDSLLSAFQQFFREHSEHWVERFDYKEAGPQLLLQAFLQRIVNSGGRIEREYGLGRMRTDLLVIWKIRGEDSKVKGEGSRYLQKIVIELKVLHKSLDKTVRQGLEQTAAYMDRCGTDAGHLVIFDRDKERSWDEKIFVRKETFEGREITVWGM